MNRRAKQKKFLVMMLAFLISAGSAEADFACGHPTNLGPKVNSSSLDAHPSISADGLSIFFYSTRSGGRGGRDIWMATRATTDDEWNAAVQSDFEKIILGEGDFDTVMAELKVKVEKILARAQ